MNIKKGEQMKKLIIAILIMSVLVLPVLADETSDLCKKIAVERFPNDYNMQTFVYNQQMESQKYMSGDRDEECKKIAQERFPRDFHMQRFVYNQQVEAYNYLVEIGTTDLEFLKDTIAYKFLLCEGILEEVDNQKKQKL